MQTHSYVIVHYHEVGLKGRNRAFFEDALVRNLARATSDIASLHPRRLPGRILVELPPEADDGAVVSRVGDVFGVANFSIAVGGRFGVETLSEAAWEQMRDRDFSTFAVRARKAHSDFSLSAREINEKVGAFLLERSGKRVNLSQPDLTCYIEVIGDLVLVYTQRNPGRGGLPVGVSGTVAVLISGGIDSPVAAARLMRRGARCVFFHFHSQPFTDRSSERHAEELVRTLTRFQYESTLWLVPLAPSQQEIVEHCSQELRTVLYRRMMMRIASALARREGAQALVTGDALGQVASQTLENLATVEAAAGMPVLRPNLGRDKLELVSEAQDLGTYEISAAPCQEACVLFEPKRPATKVSIRAADRAEAALDLERLVAEAVLAAQPRALRFPA